MQMTHLLLSNTDNDILLQYFTFVWNFVTRVIIVSLKVSITGHRLLNLHIVNILIDSINNELLLKYRIDQGLKWIIQCIGLFKKSFTIPINILYCLLL